MGNVVVAPWAPERPILAVVGQSVGRVEGQRGRPFVGPAGQQMREWLEVVGLGPDGDVYYTNVEMVYHPDDPNYLPTAKEIKAALPRIVEELADFPTIRAVVLVGAAAAHMVFKGTMTRMAGQRSEFVIPTGWVLADPNPTPGVPGGRREPITNQLPCWATWHPSGYLRLTNYKARAEREGEVLATLREVAAVSRGEEVRGVELPTPRIVYEKVVIA